MEKDTPEYKLKQRRLSIFQKMLRKKPTHGEQVFIEKCQHFGINYIFQKGFIGNTGIYIADFYLPKYRLVVEIDGKYHNRKKQRYRDYCKDKFYKSRNFNILRIKEENVESFIFDFERPKVIYTMEQYKNLKKRKSDYINKKELKEKIARFREKYPNS